MKLKELVYHGSVSIRVKGKNIRIKTPSCKALRQLNQMEEWQEEIKLPTKVDVYLKPANIDSWGTVQNLAQNPRVKTILPLQKRVLSLLKTFESRWRSRDIRLCEQTMTLATNSTSNVKNSSNDVKHHIDSDLFQTVKNSESIFCLAPPADTTIHRPMVNLAEFMSSNSICLNSYEDRIGVTVKGESLCAERLNVLKEIIKTSKRQRHDSGMDKRSPDGKKIKIEIDSKVDVSNNEKKEEGEDQHDASATTNPNQCELDGIKHIDTSLDNDKKESITLYKTDAIPNDMLENSNENIKLIDIKEFITNVTGGDNVDETKIVSTTETPRSSEPKSNKKKDKCSKKQKEARKDNFRPLLNEDVIREIKRGWTIGNVGDLTVGDLYIMFGKDFKVNLEYKWIEQIKTEPTSTTELTVSSDTEPINLPKKNDLGNKLKQLLVLANMTDKVKKKSNCSCGHICDNRVNKSRNSTEVFPRSFVSNKIYPSSHSDNGVFRQPVLPLRGGLSHIESYKHNLIQARNKQTRWFKSRNIRQSKQVIVQRLLPLQPGIAQSVVTTGVDFVANGIIRPNGLSSIPTIESSNLKTSFCSHIVDTKFDPTKKAKCNEESDSTVKTNTSTKLPTIDVSAGQKSSSSLPVIEIIDESQSESRSEQSTKATDSVDDDPCIQSIMDLSLPSNMSSDHIDEYFSYNSNPPMSPMTILRQSPTDPKWFEDNVNDFSLSSFLGQLESNVPQEKRQKSPDVESSNLSTLTEGSVDYMRKFEQLAQEMIHQEKSSYN